MIAKPIFNYMFVTANREDVTEGGILKPGNTIKNHQRVIAVGPHVSKDIAVDDIVSINWTSYEVRDWTSKPGSELNNDINASGAMVIKPPVLGVEDPTLPNGGIMVLKISDRDVDYILKQEDIAAHRKTTKPLVEVPKLEIVPGNTKFN